MGNEGKGISPDVEAYVTERLYIPNHPAGRPTSESLNVAIATAIVCAEFRRRTERISPRQTFGNYENKKSGIIPRTAPDP